MTRRPLYPYQEEAVTRALSEPSHSILIGDEPGLGKTIQATEILLRMNAERALIVGMRDTFDSWSKTAEDQSDGSRLLKRVDSTASGKRAFSELLAGDPGWYYIGWEMMAARDWETCIDDGVKKSKMKGIYRKMPALDVIVADEAHKAANRTSNARKSLGTIKAEWKIGMSGTWFGSSFANAYSITRWLWPDDIPARYYAWRDQWCAVEKTYTPHGAVDSVTGERDPGAFEKSLRCYIRRTKPEPPAAKILRVRLTDMQRKQYEALERDLLVWMESEAEAGKQPLVIDAPMHLNMRLRSVTLAEMSFDANGEVAFADDAPSAKLDAVRYVLEERWNGAPALLLTHSRRFAKIAVARLRKAGLAVAEWTGDVNSKDRDAAKADFIAGRVKYLVATIAAAGVGVDGLQLAASKILWFSEDNSPTQNVQAVNRIWRDGMTEKYGEFEQIKLIADKTVDDLVYARLLARQALNSKQLGGVRAA